MLRRRTHTELPPLAGGAKVLYEDEHVLVVDKPPGLIAAMPNDATADTLLFHVRQYVRSRHHRGPRGKGPSAWVIHTLDRHVSGLLVFARSHPAYLALKDQVRAHRVRRRYVALVEGELPTTPAGKWVSPADLEAEAGRPADTPAVPGRAGMAQGGAGVRPPVRFGPGLVKPAAAPAPSEPGQAAPGPANRRMRRDALADAGPPTCRVLAAGGGRSLVEVRLEVPGKQSIRSQLARAGHPIVEGSHLPVPPAAGEGQPTEPTGVAEGAATARPEPSARPQGIGNGDRHRSGESRCDIGTASEPVPIPDAEAGQFSQPSLAPTPRRRLALHAFELSFVHPVTGKPVRFTCPPPEEFLQPVGATPAVLGLRPKATDEGRRGDAEEGGRGDAEEGGRGDAGTRGRGEEAEGGPGDPEEGGRGDAGTRGRGEEAEGGPGDPEEGGRGDAGTRGRGEEAEGGPGDPEEGGRGDAGTRGRGEEAEGGPGDAGKRGHGDAGTRGRGESEAHGKVSGVDDTNEQERPGESGHPPACESPGPAVSGSPRPRVPASPRPPSPASPCPRVPASPRPPSPASPRPPSGGAGWDHVAGWYEGLLAERGSDYHQELVLPGIVRLLDPRPGQRVLDVACGEGLLCRQLAAMGVLCVGVDASERLIASAVRQAEMLPQPVRPAFLVGDARRLPDLVAGGTGILPVCPTGVPPVEGANCLAGTAMRPMGETPMPPSEGVLVQAGKFDAATCVLALMNMDPIEPVLAGVAGLLKPGGRLAAVILHPAFRAPGQTSWQWEGPRRPDHGKARAAEKGKPLGKPAGGTRPGPPPRPPVATRQYRRVDAYLSVASRPIVMNPGQVAAGAPAVTTVTWHRPIQAYVSAFAAAGLLVDALEEWPSHRQSEPGPRAAEEDRARREIPMFLAIRGRRV